MLYMEPKENHEVNSFIVIKSYIGTTKFSNSQDLGVLVNKLLAMNHLRAIVAKKANSILFINI